jgi:long-chain acyl-CoA synthetase
MSAAMQADTNGPNVVTPIRPVATSGWQNLVEMFFANADRFRDQPLLWTKRDGAWIARSYRQVAEEVAKLAGALKEIGVQKGDRVVIVSENRPEWCVSDLAIMAVGAITVPAYTTNTERDHQHILENAGAAFVIVSTPKLAKFLMPAVYRVDGIKAVIGIEPLRIGQESGVTLHDYATLMAGSITTPEQVRLWATFSRDDLACIIYTSGTGGAPRGVMLHHGALLSNVLAGQQIIAEDFPPTPDVFLSFLPLSHAYEHTMGQFYPLVMGSQIYYSEGLDKLASNIEETRPTIIVVVPRLFEVLRQRVMRNAEKGNWFERKLFALTISIGSKRQTGVDISWWEALVDRYLSPLVRKKVSAKFGGRVKALVSGGAPLNPEVGAFFISLGLTLLQGYGQTEAAPLISCNRPRNKIKMHTVGPPVPNTEVRIGDDGEILVRGELVMKGYWRNPEETARVLQNGWLHTGDIGHLDADGHIVITDRKKDIIVNDKGDNVSPQRVEGMVTLEPEILQAMVYGDKKPHLVALLVPDPDWLAEWTKANGKSNNLATIYADPALVAVMQTAIDRVNKNVSVIEKVRRVVIAKEAFSVDNEQMTPTLKIRRHVIKRIYGDVLESLYHA